MTTTTCPNCGKPIRPGARFCGSCGATIPQDLHAAKERLQAAPSVDPHTSACPNCGKPVRAGAKFCTHCGKEIPQAPAQMSSPAPETRRTEPGPPASGNATARPSPPPAAPARPRRSGMWPIGVPAVLIGVLVLFCIVGAAGGYLIWNDPFGWQKPKTPLAVVQAPDQTPAASPAQTETAPVVTASETPAPEPTTSQVLTETPIPIEPTATTPISTPLTFTPDLPITPQASSAPITLTSTLTAPGLAPDTVVLLQDDFNAALNVNWKAWGDPRPTIRNGFGDNWLDLKAAEKPGRAGATSRIEIDNSPGVVIEYEAQLNSSYPQFPLLLDWDPAQFDRGPENTDLTIVHLEIQKSLALLQAPAANNSCRVPLDGTVKHVYQLRFLPEKMMALYVDDSAEPLCALDMGIKPVPGRISFTGNGWVTRILITGANSQ